MAVDAKDITRYNCVRCGKSNPGNQKCECITPEQEQLFDDFVNNRLPLNNPRMVSLSLRVESVTADNGLLLSVRFTPFEGVRDEEEPKRQFVASLVGHELRLSIPEREMEGFARGRTVEGAKLSIW